MKPIPSAGRKGKKALKQVLGESERVKDMVDECAEQLASVNSDLKEELAEQDSPGVEKAIERSEVIESKVQDASDKLEVVNRALEDEVQERHVLERQLAAVTEKEEVARHAAFHDPLTGLPNRALFTDRLEHGLAQAKRHQRNLALIFMDLNGFKAINDSYGHDVGDKVLRMIAERLKNHSRTDDTVSRYGGDEFLCLLTEIRSELDIPAIVEKIIQIVEAPFEVASSRGDLSLNIQASIGISIFPKDGTTADALIKSADTAMYQSKRTKTGYSLTP